MGNALSGQNRVNYLGVKVIRLFTDLTASRYRIAVVDEAQSSPDIPSPYAKKRTVISDG